MKIINHPSIVECAKVIVEDGCHPNRWVLRRNEDSHTPYVIHRENLQVTNNGNNLEHLEFYQGSYFATWESARAQFARDYL
jgi:hypothetical protein